MEERKLTDYQSKSNLNATKVLNGKTLEPPHPKIMEKI